ncbi:unnamed protein product [Mesocestoides corti]|uniref:Alpha-1,3-glucosyltransferase n=1 Tax=Mesocestoides corti TaxID=53468 RepID=A0A0R3U698_MESCO|nr:unnamed protein product [Mesocestoides corti]
MLLCHGLEIILAGVAFKSLFFNAYHSTDFEVHRNWLAVTYSTNLSEWYTEATSKWTLDYPPFFAYFEWILAHIGRHVDPLMVVLSVEPYASPGTIYFQGITVVVSEFLLLYSICTYDSDFTLNCVCRLVSRMLEPLGPKARNQYLVAVSLFTFNFGLFIVDRILLVAICCTLSRCHRGRSQRVNAFTRTSTQDVHFQYNGFLFGVLFLSILKVFQGSFLWGGFWFAVLLNLKHTFLYLAPVYFLIILLHYCLTKDNQPPRFLFRRLFVMSVVVCGVFTASLGPFLYWGKLPDLLARLFPFQRGLCHSYWAPNFWALYNAIDKAISSSGSFLLSMTSSVFAQVRTDFFRKIDFTCKKWRIANLILEILSIVFCGLALSSR